MTQPDKSPGRIASMFDAIAGRYDLLNHLLSLGLDRRWRARAVTELQLADGERLLDLCTGTGDLAIAAAGLGDPHSIPPNRIVGVDFAAAMLHIARDKLRARELQARIALVRGDATTLPVRAQSFDAASIGFGIRNVDRPERAVAELARVLRPGGRLAILEFGFPKIPGIRALYRLYFRRLLPLIGRALSHHRDAYSYLPESVEAFQSPEAFSRMLESAGFARVRAVPLTLGIVYLFVADKA
ncbi:MAG: bifunctional demethylmenaquinone methyltransferase/2-methoxy-6-polyprenyl-1,4-benzoquinol methylase UbiE [Vicinamibacterales bacterium]